MKYLGKSSLKSPVLLIHHRFYFNSLSRKFFEDQTSSNGRRTSQGNTFLVPGATVATILMLGALHARRLYDDKKIEVAREKGAEFEFRPDIKASFLRLLPLRTISRFWGSLTHVEIPLCMRSYVYKAWARAFHSNLDEVALPLEQYVSLQHFFVRTLKEGSRFIDPDPQCLVSPVDGTILRFGELKGAGAMIEQVKGFSYSVHSLLGANSALPMIAEVDTHEDGSEHNSATEDKSDKSRLSLSWPSSKIWDHEPIRPVKGLFYCVLYLKPGDYHRVHSPVDWNVFVRRHFTGSLFPVNERSMRTIRNLYVENERVVLEGQWQEGFMAIAAIGATNIGSVQILFEPELQTNLPRNKLLSSQTQQEQLYEPEGVGAVIKKGEEVASFNMGSTVVIVFQASPPESAEDKVSSSKFRFCVKRGEQIHMGEPLGRLCNC